MTNHDADNIGRHLGQASTELDYARDETAATTEAATAVQRDMADYGFAGIARSLAAVIGQVAITHTAIAAAADAVRAASTQTAGLPGGASPSALIAALAHVFSDIASAADAVKVADAEVATAQAAIRAALHGGAPGPLLARLQRTRTTLDRASVALDVARIAVKMSEASARQAGALGAAAAGIDVIPRAERSLSGGDPVRSSEGKTGDNVAAAESKSKLARLRKKAVESGSDLAEDVGKLSDQVREALSSKSPDLCIDLTHVEPVMYQPPPAVPDIQHSAGSILDTAIFIADIVIHSYRKAHRRDR